MSVCVKLMSSVGAILFAAAMALPNPLQVDWITGAHAQGTTDAASKKSPDKDKVKYLNNGIFKIYIYADARWGPRDGKLYTATAILVRKPNVLLTTILRDEDGGNLYRLDTTRQSVTFVCDQLPDPVRMAAEAKRIRTDIENNQKSSPFFSEIRKARDEYDPLKGTAKKIKEESEKRDKEIFESLRKHRDAYAQRHECVRYEILDYDEARGLALLEATEKLDGDVPRFNISDLEVNTQIKAYGFPLEADQLQTRRATDKEKRATRFVPSITTSTVVKTHVDKKGGQLILHKAILGLGDWGGPLVNTCGDIVGLNRQPDQVKLVTAGGKSKVTNKNRGEVAARTVTVPTSSLSTAVGARELKTFLDLKNIKLANITDKSCQVAAGVFQLKDSLWVLMLGGAALLLATASMVVALRRPGPVRDAVTRMFPGGASRAAPQVSSYDSGDYGAGYSGSISSSGPHAYAGSARQALPVESLQTTPARGHEPTNIVPGLAHSGQSGVRLVPVGGGQAIVLDGADLAGDGVVFGRELESADASVNKTVSNRHAKIRLTDTGQIQIEDLGSANGTWRGSRRIQREAFSSGDQVRFGSVEFKVEMISATGNGANDTVFMPVGSWLLSGFDDNGAPLRFNLEPTIASVGRAVETTWLVGRKAEVADIVISDQRVSAEHAKIRYTPQRGLEICDLNSANGTIVDGRELSDSYVVIDDARVIEVGGTKLTLTRTS